jgi:hypothetical protein
MGSSTREEVEMDKKQSDELDFLLRQKEIAKRILMALSFAIGFILGKLL